jgi:serine/threonine protein phosphatase PrpC
VEPNDEQSGTKEAQTNERESHTPPEPAVDATPEASGGADGAIPAGETSAQRSAGEPTSTSSAPDQERQELATETAIGPYVVLRRLDDRAGRPAYLAILRESAQEQADQVENEAHNLYFVLVEGTPDEHVAAAKLAALGLHHPRLLAPRALVAHEGREYLVIETVCDPASQLPAAAAAGARLAPIETLRAGAGLADALAYLHRNGVAHLHVSPENVLVLESRAYLAGVEEATQIARGEDAAPLFARDANALARTLEMLASIPATPPPDEPPAQAAVRELAARGVVNGFSTPEEVSAACTAAVESGLQMPSLGTESASDVRLLLRAGSATTVGRVRSQNQDALSITSFDVLDDVPGGMPAGLFLVADGMGGEAHGELASRIAARSITAELARTFLLPSIALPATAVLTEDAAAQSGSSSTRELADALARAVAQANNQVRSLGERLGQATGTTLTALAVKGNHAIVAHVGDSRAYLLHGDTLMRLTEDHSLMARLEAMDHPLLHDPAFFMSRSILYRSLGQEEDTPPDLLDLPLNPGDRLLICSDGLWDELDDQTIGLTLATASNPELCAQQLVEMANVAGGHDNSTAVVLFVEGRPTDSATGGGEDEAYFEEESEAGSTSDDDAGGGEAATDEG